MESSSSSAMKRLPPRRGQIKALKRDLIKEMLFKIFKVSRSSMAGPRREQLNESLLSEENIPMVTLDAAPNDAEEDQVSYVAAKESEAPADNLAKPNSEEWIILVTSLCVEILSAACDQASSPSRPLYALFGMLLAIAALVTCIWELIYKGRKRGYDMLFGSVIELSVIELFGFIGGIAQCVCSIIQYVYYVRRDENPIKLSLLPAIFLICLIAARLSRKRMQTRDETREHTA